MIIWQYVKLPFKSHKKRDYVRSKKTESMKRLTKKKFGHMMKRLLGVITCD